jgi:hypothetical protein
VLALLLLVLVLALEPQQALADTHMVKDLE